MATEPSCKACNSSKLIELTAEICLHFPGPSGLKTDPIFLFPKIVVCSDCGLMQANLSAGDLEQIRQGVAKVEGAPAQE
jgi:hypothetical protein